MPAVIKDLIIVVEDSQYQAAELVDMIGEQYPDHKVEWANSINAGLRAIDKSSVSPEVYGRLVLVLTDLGLPVESGGVTEFELGNFRAAEDIFQKRIKELGLVARVVGTSARDDVLAALDELDLVVPVQIQDSSLPAPTQSRPPDFAPKDDRDSLMRMVMEQLALVPKIAAALPKIEEEGRMQNLRHEGTEATLTSLANWARQLDLQLNGDGQKGRKGIYDRLDTAEDTLNFLVDQNYVNRVRELERTVLENTEAVAENKQELKNIEWLIIIGRFLDQCPNWLLTLIGVGGAFILNWLRENYG